MAFDQETGLGSPTGVESQEPTQGAAGAGSPGAGWTMPEHLRGKSTEDVARMYSSLEQKLGEQGNELGSLRQYATQMNSWVENWKPVLQAAGYRPERVAAALQRMEAGTDTPKDRQMIERTTQAAMAKWGDALTPGEQEQWISQQIQSNLEKHATQLNQQLYDGLQAAVGYFNRYGDFALRAIEQKFQNPQLSITDLLQDAVRYVSQPPDPIAYAAAMRQMPNVLQQIQANAEKTAREQYEATRKNQELTTGIGAGGAPRPFPFAAPTGPAPRPSGAPAGTRPARGWNDATDAAGRRVASALANL